MEVSLLPYHQPPWIMLAEPHSQHELILPEPLNPPPPRGFVIVGEQHIYHFNLPQSAHQARFIGSTGNWLIFIDLEKMIRLLNPFSGVQIDLPSLDCGLLEDEEEEEDEIPLMPPDFYRDCGLPKVILSSSPSDSKKNEDCIAMAIRHYSGKLAIARPGDAAWTTVETPDNDPMAQDVIFYKDQFYFINYNGTLSVCDLSVHPPNASLLIDGFLGEYNRPDIMHYLVEWLGELLLVLKYMDYHGEGVYKTNRFEIYKLDFGIKKWTMLKNLGEYTLFLGSNTSISVLASDYFESIKKNCIYFTDDFTLGYVGSQTAGGHDMGVFNFDDGSIQQGHVNFSLFTTHLDCPNFAMKLFFHLR